MNSDILKHVYQQISSRGPLKPREVRGLVSNYSGGECVTGAGSDVAVTVAADLGNSVQWIETQEGPRLASTVEQKLLQSVSAGPVKLSALHKSERLWWREHQQRLSSQITEKNNTLTITPKHTETKKSIWPGCVDDNCEDALRMLKAGTAFLLGANWIVPHRTRHHKSRKQKRQAWLRVLRMYTTH